MKKVDMSEKAILKRFNQTEQLREVSLFLMKAKKAQGENSSENKKTDRISITNAGKNQATKR